MGYTLRIGQLKTMWHVDDGRESRIRNEAAVANSSDAPRFGEPTDGSNERWPSYTIWKKFSDFVELNEFFYNKVTGVLRHHPGCVPLCIEHKTIVDKAYANFKEKYPDAVGGYSTINKGKPFYEWEEDPTWPIENEYLARLEWLKFWMDWALENCTEPVFENH